MLPIFGAVGGMVAPAALYVALNLGSEGIRGWGIPMATDIAFVIGVMAVIGRRVPPGLKVFLVALAIVDDIGAVLVIATFYTASIDVQALVVMLGFFIALLAMNRLGVQRISVYVVLGLGLWLATLESGVHATIAGVLLALTIPARAGTDAQGYVERARRLLDDFVRSGESGSGEEALSRQQASLQALEGTYQDMTSPLQKMEHALQPRVVYVIVPIFALANAGVSLTGESEAGLISAVSVGIILGLVLGKPIGISLAAWLAVKAGIAGLPSGVRWRQIVGAGMLGGIGFTMSLFIAALAFGEQAALLTNAKLGILVASAIAGVIGYAFLRATPRSRARPPEHRLAAPPTRLADARRPGRPRPGSRVGPRCGQRLASIHSIPVPPSTSPGCTGDSACPEPAEGLRVRGERASAPRRSDPQPVAAIRRQPATSRQRRADRLEADRTL